MPKCCNRKQALNTENGGPTRWDCLFLTPVVPKRTEMALPVPTIYEPSYGHAVCTLQVHPPTSPYPALSAEGEPISKGHCWKWHYEAESLMMYICGMGPKNLNIPYSKLFRVFRLQTSHKCPCSHPNTFNFKHTHTQINWNSIVMAHDQWQPVQTEKKLRCQKVKY